MACRSHIRRCKQSSTLMVLPLRGQRRDLNLLSVHAVILFTQLLYRRVTSINLGVRRDCRVILHYVRRDDSETLNNSAFKLLRERSLRLTCSFRPISRTLPTFLRQICMAARCRRSRGTSQLRLTSRRTLLILFLNGGVRYF